MLTLNVSANSFFNRSVSKNVPVPITRSHGSPEYLYTRYDTRSTGFVTTNTMPLNPDDIIWGITSCTMFFDVSNISNLVCPNFKGAAAVKTTKSTSPNSEYFFSSIRISRFIKTAACCKSSN